MEEIADDNTDPPPDYQLYVDIPDWKNIPPPPAYEDAVIFGMDSYPPAYDQGKFEPNQNQANGCTLGYVDFLPRHIEQNGKEPVFEDFKVLMTMANDWLKVYPNYKVIRCEVIERKLNKSGFVEADATIQFTPAYGIDAFVLGLRLWLTWKRDKSPVQQIWYMNVLPKPIAQTIYYGRMRARGGLGYSNYQMTMQKKTIYPDFEDLDKTIDQLNAKLTQTPIPGSILNIECKDMKYCSNFWDPKIYDPYKHPYNPDKGYWGNTKQDGILYLTVLKIFFVQGAPQSATIGLQDFTPACVSYVSGGKPNFESMSTVMSQANQWILANSKNVRITNVNAMQSKVNIAFGAADTDRIESNSRSTFYSAGSSEVTYVNFIRVAYVMPGKVESAGLSVKSFVPIRYPGNKSEPLYEVVNRINAWLISSGAKVQSADTLDLQFSPTTKKAIDMEKSSSTVPPSTGLHWITVIQLYINGGYIEPPLEVYTPAPDFVENANSSGSCNII